MNHFRVILIKIWGAILTVLLVIFTLLSANSLLPLKMQFPSWKLSPNLTEKTKETANGVRVDYVNSKGVITVALDKNYSTVIKTLDKNGNCILEQYFDNHGRHATLESGNSALQRRYNSKGQWVCTTYLDKNLEPVISKFGYASITRTYNDINKVETEQYYDTKGSPTADNNKRFGVRFEYNDDERESVAISINAAGNAMYNKDHYAISKKTYTSDGILYMVMYYDINGNPVVLSYGQSGYIYEKGKPICVDQNGRKMFVLRHFLHNSISIVIVIGCLLLIIIMLSNLQTTFLLLVLYLIFIAYMTIINRDAGVGVVTWRVPQNYYLFFTNIGLLANTWLFIPLGAILYKLSHMWEIISFPIIISLLIEISQLVFDIGAFEISDLVTNSLGGIIGVVMCYMLEPMVTDCIIRLRSNSPDI